MKRMIVLALTVGVFLSFSTEAHATLALCFNCGELHFGALVRCKQCFFQPDMANQDLWILFSDHFFSPDTLAKFGTNIKKIRIVCPDFDEGLWIFLQYIVDNYPEIIDRETFRLPPEYQERVPLILKKVNLTVFPLEGRQ